MSWGDIWDFLLAVGRAYIYGSIVVAMIVSFLIWSFTSSIQSGKMEPEVLEKARGRRDKMIRFAARHGLWGSNYSLAEQVEVTDVGLSLIDTEDGDPEVKLILVDKYDTMLELELDLNPEGLLQMASVYRKVTSPEAKKQLEMMRETFRSNTQC